MTCAPQTKRLTPQRSGGMDTYQTPPEAIEPLMKFIPNDWTIWEPTADQGLLVSALKNKNYDVVGTTYDFLKHEPQFWDCIITNPPYSIKNKFLKRCYELNKPFALLMPITSFEGIERQALYKKYGLEVLLLNRRINYIVPNGQHESGSWFASAWFCKGILPNQLNFGILPKSGLGRFLE